MNTDTIYNIMEFSEPNETVNLSLVNKFGLESLKRIKQTNSFWHQIYMRKFRLNPLSGDSDLWKQNKYRRKINIESIGFFGYNWMKIYNEESNYRTNLISHINTVLPNIYISSMTMDILYTLDNKLVHILINMLKDYDYPIFTPNMIYDLLSESSLMGFYDMIQFYSLLPKEYINSILSQNSQLYLNSKGPIMIDVSIDRKFIEIVTSSIEDVKRELSMEITPIQMNHENYINQYNK